MVGGLAGLTGQPADLAGRPGGWRGRATAEGEEEGVYVGDGDERGWSSGNDGGWLGG